MRPISRSACVQRAILLPPPITLIWADAISAVLLEQLVVILVQVIKSPSLPLPERLLRERPRPLPERLQQRPRRLLKARQRLPLRPQRRPYHRQPRLRRHRFPRNNRA